VRPASTACLKAMAIFSGLEAMELAVTDPNDGRHGDPSPGSPWRSCCDPCRAGRVVLGGLSCGGKGCACA
jgi:hypothetical protein